MVKVGKTTTKPSGSSSTRPHCWTSQSFLEFLILLDDYLEEDDTLDSSIQDVWRTITDRLNARMYEVSRFKSYYGPQPPFVFEPSHLMDKWKWSLLMRQAYDIYPNEEAEEHQHLELVQETRQLMRKKGKTSPLIARMLDTDLTFVPPPEDLEQVLDKDLPFFASNASTEYYDNLPLDPPVVPPLMRTPPPPEDGNIFHSDGKTPYSFSNCTVIIYPTSCGHCPK